MNTPDYREIQYNYTSADDRRVIRFLLGEEILQTLEVLRQRRRTGRSARLVMRLIGEVFIHLRNPYLFHELVKSSARRKALFQRAAQEIELLGQNTNDPIEVKRVLDACTQALNDLRERVLNEPHRQAELTRLLHLKTASENVSFHPFDVISHSTDATDWRLYLPVGVVRPANPEEAKAVLGALADSGYGIIIRGGGTGLTGGAVPLTDNCVVINTEKLNRIHPVGSTDIADDKGDRRTVPTLTVEAGAITEDVMAVADRAGLVFSADPTSAWASTIGGNVAENAGGKKAVRWGTTLDSILSYTMIFPDGTEVSVRRRHHPLRKILPDDTVTFEVFRENGTTSSITLNGEEIRKKGVWKDITNKVLGGLPGFQKEGTDGIITEATFVLYPKYEESRTVCLEFFGDTMDEACEVIQKISDAFPPGDEEALLAMEHFDDKYAEAIDYRVKADRNASPKAVLLIDIVGHTVPQAERGVDRLRTILQAHENTELHVAAGDDEAAAYWKDRKNLGAIAARTNAFKLNEDIVLPIPALAEFVRFVDDLNHAEHRHNLDDYLHLAQEVLDRLSIDDDDLLPRKIDACRDLIVEAKANVASGAAADDLEGIVKTAIARMRRQFQGYPDVQTTIDELYASVRKCIIVVATHMHAGDGNVHVNIPVFSNDRNMMARAEHAVDLVMDKVKAFGGVVSGEHGIGITKLKYWGRDRMDGLRAYRKTVDPKGIMNPGKLDDLELMDLVYTPSFNLLELEARILHYGGLESLAHRVAQCVRCGKCKGNCCVFYPKRNMFFHPRNKNLAIGSLTEALLYDAQSRQDVGFEMLKHLEEIADHCTVCHKCVTPCPVNIDTGDVSIFERELLTRRQFKHTSPVTKLTLQYLQSDSKLFNALFRSTALVAGGAIQRLFSKSIGRLLAASPLGSTYPAQLLDAPMPKADAGTLHADLPALNSRQALVLAPDGPTEKTIFYFPGCGSERLFSDVSRAAILCLLKQGIRVVLPPPYLCCGFPAHANAKTEMNEKTVLKDLILFSQIREMLSYYAFDACLVTCGTCKESLSKMKIQDIFDCDLMDTAFYLQRQGASAEGQESVLYHAPCHDSLDGKAATVLSKMLPGALTAVPHCCSEAGTLAISRPDIASAMRERKRDALDDAVKETGAKTILTNCPSCLQGLGRNAAVGAKPCHVAVALARRLVGEDWKNEFHQAISTAEVIAL